MNNLRFSRFSNHRNPAAILIKGTNFKIIITVTSDCHWYYRAFPFVFWKCTDFIFVHVNSPPVIYNFANWRIALYLLNRKLSTSLKTLQFFNSNYMIFPLWLNLYFLLMYLTISGSCPMFWDILIKLFIPNFFYYFCFSLILIHKFRTNYKPFSFIPLLSLLTYILICCFPCNIFFICNTGIFWIDRFYFSGK